jgi:hypothetical protein
MVDWPDAIDRMDWRQGQHITLIGPTGRGKTELTIRLLEQINWVVFLGTKRRDRTQDRLRGMGYETVQTAPEINPEIHSRYILRPPYPRRVSAASLKKLHSEVFRDGLMTCYRQTGWTIALDEAKYLCAFLGLSEECALLWQQGRSQGNALIASVQRSRYVPLEAYDQATHLFMWTDPDLSNVKRNSELAGFNRSAVIDAMRLMTMHDVLYVNTVTEDMFITNTRWE